MNLFTKQKQSVYSLKTNGYQRGNMEAGRDKSGAWDERIHPALYKIDNQ